MNEGKESSLSPKAQVVWDTLNEQIQKTIQKDNPFRNDRDDAIRELAARGVKFPVLAEISGMSRNGVYSVVHRRNRFKSINEKFNGKLISIKGAINTFLYSIRDTLHNNSAKGGDED